MFEYVTFYKSYDEAMEMLPENEQMILYRAIIKYGLYEHEPELDGVMLNLAWTLILPQIKANHKNSINGKKGGRPTSDSKKEKKEQIEPLKDDLEPKKKELTEQQLKNKALIDEHFKKIPKVPTYNTNTDTIYNHFKDNDYSLGAYAKIGNDYYIDYKKQEKMKYYEFYEGLVEATILSHAKNILIKNFNGFEEFLDNPVYEERKEFKKFGLDIIYLQNKFRRIDIDGSMSPINKQNTNIQDFELCFAYWHEIIREE